MEISKDLKGKELTAFLVSKLDELADGLCQDPEEIERFVQMWDASLGLHDYSINNVILAWFQYPQVSMLAGYRRWQGLGRIVRKNEKAIKVLAPLTRKIKDKNCEEDTFIISGWRYVNVFDVNQTEGENLDFGHSDKIKGTISFEAIKEISPLPVEVRYDGTSNGNITLERIVIAPKNNEAAMVATLLHEIAHYKLGHLGSELDKDTKELEAETVSFIVCCYLGLDNQKSHYYIGAWKGDQKKLKGKGKHLISVAESIIRDISRGD